MTDLDENGLYKHLSLPETEEFLSLLTADNAGTTEWAESLQEFSIKYNLKIGDLT
jgi:hypothetical protein